MTSSPPSVRTKVFINPDSYSKSFSVSFNPSTLKALNKVVGTKGKRSEFIEVAVREKLGLPSLE